jgi:drug/metabolite transporter (DMT)-like permease
VKIALRGLSPVQIVLAQLAIGAVVLLVASRLARQSLPRTRTTWLHLAVMAIVANIAPYLLFTWGQQHIPSGLAGILNATTPLFALLISLAAHFERASISRSVGLAIGFVGVGILSSPWDGTGGSSLAGAGACLVAGFCYAVSYVYARHFLTGRGTPPLALSAGQLTVGAVLLGITAPFVAMEPVRLTASTAAAVLMLGLFSTGVAYVLNYRLIQDEGATSASTVTYLIPVVALALGAIVLGERLTWSLLAGAIIVLTGVALSEGRVGGSSWSFMAARSEREDAGKRSPEGAKPGRPI